MHATTLTFIVLLLLLGVIAACRGQEAVPLDTPTPVPVATPSSSSTSPPKAGVFVFYQPDVKAELTELFPKITETEGAAGVLDYQKRGRLLEALTEGTEENAFEVSELLWGSVNVCYEEISNKVADAGGKPTAIAAGLRDIERTAGHFWKAVDDSEAIYIHSYVKEAVLEGAYPTNDAAYEAFVLDREALARRDGVVALLHNKYYVNRWNAAFSYLPAQANNFIKLADSCEWGTK